MTVLTTVEPAKPRRGKTSTRTGQVFVSAVALARHLDCSRSYVQKLESEGVFHREGDGFPLDASRIAYLRYLRRERQRSPRSEADANFQVAKTELIRMRIQEKQRDLIPMDEAVEVTDKICGVVMTALGGLPARCAGYDLSLRRKIEQVIFELRTSIGDAARKFADQAGEPHEDDAA